MCIFRNGINITLLRIIHVLYLETFIKYNYIILKLNKRIVSIMYLGVFTDILSIFYVLNNF